MSLGPNGGYIGPPGYPDTWTTSLPKEGLRDEAEARIISLSPDVCLTPVGNSVVPIPYPVIDNCGDDQGYTPTVRFTRQKAMVLRSNTTCVHGDAPGSRKGVKSGTVGDICEPIGHAAQVRAEGSPVVRHLDRFHMNKQNTVGEAIFVRNLSTYEAPLDDDPLPGSLVLSDWAGPEQEMPGVQYAQAAPELLPESAPRTVTDATPDTRPSSTRQPANDNRAPQLDRRGTLGRPSTAAASRILTLLGIAELGLATGDMAGRWYVGPDGVMGRAISDHLTRDISAWSPQGQEIGRYVGFPSFGRDAHIDYANDLLSLKAGRPLDFREMNPEDLEELLEAPWPDAQTLRENAERLRNPEPEEEEDPLPVPVPPPDTVRIDDEEEDEQDCLVGPYEEIEPQCDGEAHHIVPDMAYRLGTRPTTAAQRSSTENRIPNAPTFNQGMSICLTSAQHGSGPDGLHGQLRGPLEALSTTSPVPGTAPIESILELSVGSIMAIPDLPPECKTLAATSVTEQVLTHTGLEAPGRVKERPLPSGEAHRVLSAGSY